MSLPSLSYSCCGPKANQGIWPRKASCCSLFMALKVYGDNVSLDRTGESKSICEICHLIYLPSDVCASICNSCFCGDWIVPSLLGKGCGAIVHGQLHSWCFGRLSLTYKAPPYTVPVGFESATKCSGCLLLGKFFVSVSLFSYP
jgi:hypothetical protein